MSDLDRPDASFDAELRAAEPVGATDAADVLVLGGVAVDTAVDATALDATEDVSNDDEVLGAQAAEPVLEIGRASCRERVCYVV